MVKVRLFLSLVISFFLLSCGNQGIKKVEIKKTEMGYQLFRGGEPFYIKGACINDHYGLLKEYGGNSIRTWGVSSWDEVFEMADKYDLTVFAGIWLEQERQGFDYNDKEAVEKQFEEIKKSILKYKDHPALLMWGIGNELDLNYTNPKVWDAVEQVAKFIHEVDGNHPTLTTTAFIEKEEVELIKAKCPNIDILCVNTYAGLPVLSKFLNDFKWDGPYVVGEWGPFGHWEVNQTSWNEPIEHTSSEKAALYQKEYTDYIKNDPNCLGSYVFLWGSKQERTATWYSMFLPQGEKTEAVDVVWNLWNEGWPQNKAPRLDSLVLNGRKADDNIIIKPDAQLDAKVFTTDPENDSLKVVWEILHETTDKRSGGDEEEKPLPVEGLDTQQADKSLQFNAPKSEGAYRLFVYVYDQKGSGAHANIPFYVEK
jgi:hypothetical protein